ncbi:MAG: glycosyltransferase family 4 protein [Flavobacteriales bacterium]|nr:glycosyltransferase family 4 protein [Flavobacteriales bacterium]
MALVVNGRYLDRPVTGVERYSDMLVRMVAREWPSARIHVPKKWQGASEVHGIEVIRTGSLQGHAWEQLSLPRSLGPDDVLLSPANTGPLCVKRQAVVIHDLATIHHPELFNKWFASWYRFLLPNLARRAARVIPVSTDSAEALDRTLGTSENKVFVVPPFAQPTDMTYRDVIGEPYVLSVGSRDPRKGLDRLVKWYSSLVDPGYRLVIVGRQVSSFRPRPLAPHPGIIDRNDVSDDDLNALYTHAIALIQPSVYEGFGLPILEALALGCPVIASNLPVFVRNFGGSLLYFPINHTDAFDPMVDGLRVQNRRVHFAARGRQRAAQFTQQRMAEALHAAIDPLLHTA